jgi:hypothetical protein
MKKYKSYQIKISTQRRSFKEEYCYACKTKGDQWLNHDNLSIKQYECTSALMVDKEPTTEITIDYNSLVGYEKRRYVLEGWESIWEPSYNDFDTATDCPISECKLMDKTCTDDLTDTSKVTIGGAESKHIEIKTLDAALSYDSLKSKAEELGGTLPTVA